MNVSRTLVVMACIGALIAAVPAEAQNKKQAKEAEKFRSQGQQARVAIEKARDQLQKTVEAYDALLGAPEKKLQSAHKKLNSEVGKTEKVVQDGSKQVTAFRDTAEKFFVTWEQGVAEISTESIRNASQKRYDAALAAFENMKESLGAASEAYQPLMSSLKEQVTLLGQDLTPDTVEMLKTDVAPDIHAQAEKVFASIEASLSKEKMHEEEVGQILAEEEAAAEDEAPAEEEGEE